MKEQLLDSTFPGDDHVPPSLSTGGFAFDQN